MKHQSSPHPQAHKLSNESNEQELKEYQQKLHQANLKQNLLKNEVKIYKQNFFLFKFFRSKRWKL